MSLDVYVKYREPKTINYSKTHSACGSTMMVCDDDYECVEEHWNANVTHNMGKMSSHIPVGESLTLYDVVWRPDEHEISNTDELVEKLEKGIIYMTTHRSELIQYNPENGWGDYDSFLIWLTKYKQACDENPGCEIYVGR